MLTTIQMLKSAIISGQSPNVISLKYIYIELLLLSVEARFPQSKNIKHFFE